MIRRYLGLVWAMASFTLGLVLADDVQNGYVGKSACIPELSAAVHKYGMRLDKTQNAYLAARTVRGANLLMIVQYAGEQDKCGVIRDVVESRVLKSSFEFDCVNCAQPSVVVVGTWPNAINASSTTAVEAWAINLKELRFIPLQKRVTCIRRTYHGTDQGEDLATWERGWIKKHCSQAKETRR
jgi:hypothetical protein